MNTTVDMIEAYRADLAAGRWTGTGSHADFQLWHAARQQQTAAPVAPAAPIARTAPVVPVAAPVAPVQPAPNFAEMWKRAIAREARALGLPS